MIVTENSKTKIRVVGHDNRKGLTKDIYILHKTLSNLGVEVDFVEISEKTREPLARKALNFANAVVRSPYSSPKKQITIFVERIVPELLEESQFNLVIPNPEWFHPAWRFFEGTIDAILCKSYHALDIYNSLGFTTRYLGFTSPDKGLEGSTKKQPEFLHVAGGSHFKGTAKLVEIWEQHPDWPLLVIVTNRVLREYTPKANNIKILNQFMDDHALRKMQNEILFHVYPSQAEGFGHCINEAMSCGAIVLTNNAAPMNELVTSKEGFLFDCHPTGRQYLSPLVEFDAQAFAQQIHRAIAESPDIQKARCEHARRAYEARDLHFATNLRSIILEYLAAL